MSWKQKQELRSRLGEMPTPSKNTDKVTRCTHSPTCHLPPSAYPGNPFPSSSLSGKSMNTEGHLRRQVRISLSKPHNAPARHKTHYQPKQTWLTGLCIHLSDHLLLTLILLCHSHLLLVSLDMNISTVKDAQ